MQLSSLLQFWHTVHTLDVLNPTWHTSGMSLEVIYPVTDHEFSHNIVKVAVDPQGDS